MSRGCGPYGPPLVTLHTKKEWNGKQEWWKKGQLEEFIKYGDMYTFDKLLPYNHYEAEYYDED
ncbi:MAG: hypothetical protein R2685_10515 [Candidatus Nitrosocosmicus sp.]|nr:hypothetical protein [Candidatus Nitrosocosmicus sp.]